MGLTIDRFRRSLELSGVAQLFCPKPFEHFEVQSTGLAYLCCPGWLEKPIGHAGEGAVQLWNGARAQLVRESILDGSFRYCTGCPFLANEQGPVRRIDEVTNPEHLEIIRTRKKTVERIKFLNVGYDRTCNLSCPTCRKDVIVATGSALRRLHVYQEALVTKELLRSLDVLYVTGAGDPFASSVFRSLLRSIDAREYPALRIFLHTNALLFTESNWQAMELAQPLVHEVSVSIDAACPETYALNRRGGEWESLLDRLGFIQTLRATGAIKVLAFNFVVQANNWREMPDFVRLARRYGADLTLFTPVKDWGIFSEQELESRSVHLASHPENGDFRQLLATEPVLQEPQVVLADFSGFRADTAIQRRNLIAPHLWT